MIDNNNMLFGKFLLNKNWSYANIRNQYLFSLFSLLYFQPGKNNTCVFWNTLSK